MKIGDLVEIHSPTHFFPEIEIKEQLKTAIVTQIKYRTGPDDYIRVLPPGDTLKELWFLREELKVVSSITK